MAADADPKALTNLLSRARYCTGPCQCVKREGHAHKTRSGHEIRLLSNEEKVILRAQWLEEQERGKDAKRDRLEAEREEQRGRRAQEGVAAEVPSATEWKLDFGKHKGKTLSQVERSDPEYLVHLVAQRIDEGRLRFKEALIQSGRHESLLAKAEAKRRRSVREAPWKWV